MLLIVNTIDPESEKRWNHLLNLFNVKITDQGFLRAVLQENKLSAQLDKDAAERIHDKHYQTLSDYYSIDLYIRMNASAGTPFALLISEYCKFVIDCLQTQCRKNIHIEGEQNLLFKALKNLENKRVANLTSTDEFFIEKGVKVLAQHLNVETSAYQSYLLQRFQGKGVSKAGPIAIKLIKILGGKPNCRLQEDEYRRFKKYRDFGMEGFSDLPPNSRATLKATTEKPLELLRLTQHDLKALWNDLK